MTCSIEMVILRIICSVPEQHEETSTKRPKLLSCPECDKKFRYPSKVLQHQKSHEDRGSFSCNLCDASYKSAATLAKHKWARHGEKKAANKVPNSESTEIPGSSMHMCPECKEYFSNRRNVRLHYNRAHNPEKFTLCDQCGKILTSLEGYQKHMDRFHGWGDPHKCAHCHKSLKNVHSQRYHYARYHPGVKVPSTKKVIQLWVIANQLVKFAWLLTCKPNCHLTCVPSFRFIYLGIKFVLLLTKGMLTLTQQTQRFSNILLPFLVWNRAVEHNSCLQPIAPVHLTYPDI